MTNQEFKLWIEGYLTLTDDESIDHSQVIIIRNHANLVEAVTGNLEEGIRFFVTQLENEIKKQPSIPYSFVKQCFTHAFHPSNNACA